MQFPNPRGNHSIRGLSCYLLLGNGELLATMIRLDLARWCRIETSSLFSEKESFLARLECIVAASSWFILILESQAMCLDRPSMIGNGLGYL